MKRSTPRHPKMYALADALSIPLAHAVGIMEMLWHHAGQHTPQGDIGRLPDSAIAEAVGWKKPDQLRESLVLSGWIDCHPEYRLVIHDWPDHCEQSVVKILEYNHKDFLPIYRVSLENRKRKSRDSLPSRVGVGRDSLPSRVGVGLDLEVFTEKKKPEVSQLWESAGFDSLEHFESWWVQVVQNHPSKHRNREAYGRIQELVIAGQFVRSEFEFGYSQLRESKADDWTKDGGKYCTNLADIVRDQLWKFKPVAVDNWVRELTEEQALEGRLE